MKDYWRQKTKIVATIGPASARESVLQAMLERGMDAARLNFSHGTYDEHKQFAASIRRLSKQMGISVALIQDISGPKIRIGELENGTIRLKRGDRFVLTTKEGIGNDEIVSVNFRSLPRFVRTGDILLIDDGTKRLRVTNTSDTEVHTIVDIGGELGSHKGINVPSVKAKDVLTDKDWDDLKFGISLGVDYVALSFIRTAQDIIQVRQFLATHKSRARIIAKIEKRDAVDNLESIIDAADGIMVARGDLGIEVSIEEVPLIQKRAIILANSKGKPVITATQMLESMITSPTPTRAEATDIANAILDGTDATMLSAETATGDDPALVIKTMESIAKKTLDVFPYEYWLDTSRPDMNDTASALAYASVILADSINSKIIVSLTESGDTARFISRHKPKQLIFTLSQNETTVNQLALSWGVLPLKIRRIANLGDALTIARNAIKQEGLLKENDPYVVVAGKRFGDRTVDNMLLVQRL